MKKLALLALVVVLGIALSPVAAGEPRDRDQKASSKTSLDVRITPAMAFAPAHVVLHAELKGGNAESQDLYCPTVEWDWGDGTVSESSSDCEPFQPNKTEIERSFSTEHVYKFGGAFTVQLRLKHQSRVVATGVAMVNIGAALGEGGDIRH